MHLSKHSLYSFKIIFHHGRLVIFLSKKIYVSHPDSGSDPNGGSEPSSGRETIYWDSLPVFFFFLRAELVPVGIQTISVITKIIYIHKRTTTGVVSIHIYTHILSPIYLYIYKNNFTIQIHIQSAEPTVMNPY